MKKVQSADCECERIRQHFDSYVSNESTPKANQEVLRHLEICPACAAELEARTRLRTRLKTAVERQYVPGDLQARVRERIQNRESGSWWRVGWNRRALAMAASLAVCFGVWLNYSRPHMPALSDRPGQDAYIQRVSASLTPILKVGLRDHIHCSVFRKYPRNPPTAAEMLNELGPPYKGLLALVKAAVSDQYRVVMAHQCGYAGRKYVHLTLQNRDELMSLVITRKNTGESMSGLAPVLSASGIPVYQSTAQQYEVAAFDAGQYVAFVVSDVRAETNLQIATDLAPRVHEFLAKLSV
jgi:anti-sigma factor (TIGR02949 family)